MKYFDAPTNNPMAPRLFAYERGGLEFDVEVVDTMNLQNRRSAFREINPRGEVPALQLDDGTVITETTAISQYFDETATGGKSLYGENAKERAETQMWIRRMDLEIVQPVIALYRNDPDTIDFYQGNRIPIPEARVTQRVQIHQALNQLEGDLERKAWLCGDRFSAADIHFFSIMYLMFTKAFPGFLPAGRSNVKAYWERMEARDATQKAIKVFPSKVSIESER